MFTIHPSLSRQHLGIIFILFLLVVSITAPVNAQSVSGEFVIGEISNVPTSTTNTTNGVIYDRRATTHTVLAEMGYVEGENVTYIFDPELSSGDNLVIAAEALIEADPDLIIAYGAAAAVVMKTALGDRDIPIVFVGGTDPVEGGLVTSLQNTEGNVTGIGASSEVYGKQLEWLLLIDPTIERVYIPLGAFQSPINISAMSSIQKYADSVNVEVVIAELPTPEAITEAATNLGEEDVDAIMLLPTLGASPDFVAASIEFGLPLTAAFPNNMDAGPLLSYNYTEEIAGTQAARYIDLILRGAAPNTLPVELVPNSLVINLKTAEAMGITISDEILLQADIIVR